MNDKLLANAIQNDDSHAFQILFERYYEPLLAYLNTLTNDFENAEDIAQQAFITLWEERKRLKLHTSPKPYIYRIAYNIYIDQFRAKKKQAFFISELKYLALKDYVLESSEETDNRITKLMDIVHALPPKCQEILRLSKQENLKYKEIAEHLQISLKTVDAQLQIAYKKIRESFSGGS